MPGPDDPQQPGATIGMAETTPGPLIQVIQFVAFLGAYRNPGSLDPCSPAFSPRFSSPG